jgi:flagellin-like protein
MQNKRDENAVSEVMGTILMVALVVILAAIIGAFVFGMVGSVQDTKVISVTATRINETYLSLTFYGGDRADQVLWMNVSINGIPRGSIGTIGGTNPVRIGNSTLFSGATSSNTQVIVIGAFTDGSQQVVLDTTV